MLCYWANGSRRFKGAWCLQNVENHWPNDTASHPRRLQTSFLQTSYIWDVLSNELTRSIKTVQVPDESTELCHAERSWPRVNKSSINLCAATIYKHTQKHKPNNTCSELPHARYCTSVLQTECRDCSYLQGSNIPISRYRYRRFKTETRNILEHEHDNTTYIITNN